MQMLNQNTREVLRLLLGELDPNDAYSDLMRAADTISLLYNPDAVVRAVNISLVFINMREGELH